MSGRNEIRDDPVHPDGPASHGPSGQNTSGQGNKRQDTHQSEGAGNPGAQRLFGRHKGKPLRGIQQTLMDTLLPRLRLPLQRNGPVHPGQLDPHTLFDAPVRDIWLEIGYGGGEHLAAQAAANRDIGFIGCEFFSNGIAKLLRRINDEGLHHIRLYDHDARDVLTALPDASVGRLFLLFPDPWPKTKHFKRRFIQPETVASLARVLRPGGEFRLASDIPSYIAWSLRHLRGRGNKPWAEFDWLDEGPSDWADRGPDWPGTRYEAKAFREGRVPVYLTFRRKKS